MRVLNDDLVRRLGISTPALEAVTAREEAELHRERPARIVVAVPVAAAEACDEFRADVEDVVCVATPEPFTAVGAWYEDFSQTTDEEVRHLLDEAARIPAGRSNA